MPLTLATSLRTFVTSSSRSRGEAYFRAGRVIPRRADATSFNAAVSGTRSYDVSLLVDGDRLLADCTCPYFAGTREPCKHIWATILAADEARRLTLTGDLWLDVGEEELGVEETDQLSGGSRPSESEPAGRHAGVPVAAAAAAGMAGVPVARHAAAGSHLHAAADGRAHLRARSRALVDAWRVVHRLDDPRPQEIGRLGQAESPEHQSQRRRAVGRRS